MRVFICEPWTSAAPLFADATIDGARWVGLIVAGVALAFGVWQVREQRDRVRRPKTRFGARPEKELEFLKRQAFRRMQIGGLAAIVGGLMLVGLYVPPQNAPGWWAASWLGVLFFSVWTALLALVDAISTWLYFSGESAQTDAEKILLQYQMKKMSERVRRAANETETSAPSQDEGTTRRAAENAASTERGAE